MKRSISGILILALVVGAQGCATLKNTKVPKAFDDVGVCGHCKMTVALDELDDDESAICPECGARFIAREARVGFRKLVVARRNQKTARSFFAAVWLAASVAGTIYGIPLPPPPMNAETFSPYRTPFSIACRKAKRAPEDIPSYGEVLIDGAPLVAGNLYLATWLPNPYEKVPRPYSMVINDFDDANVRNEKLGKVSLYLQEDMIYLLSPTR